MYVIKVKNNSYLMFDKNHKPTVTTNITLAEKFTDQKAEAFIKNCITPNKRSNYSIEYISDEKKPNVKKQEADNDSHELLPFSIKTLDNTLDKVNNLHSELFTTRKEFSKQLSLIDKEKLDIDHYIEIRTNMGKKFNAIEMCSLFRQISDIFQRRRIVKDNILRINILLNIPMKDFTKEKIYKSLEATNNKSYTPRVLLDLFANL